MVAGRENEGGVIEADDTSGHMEKRQRGKMGWSGWLLIAAGVAGAMWLGWMPQYGRQWVVVRQDILGDEDFAATEEYRGDFVRHDLTLPSGSVVRAGIGFTSKGNGALAIGDMRIQAVDWHADESMFANGVLHIDTVRWVDAGREGLRLHGVKLLLHEYKDIVIGEREVDCVLMYDPITQRFDVLRDVGHIVLESGWGTWVTEEAGQDKDAD